MKILRSSISHFTDLFLKHKYISTGFVLLILGVSLYSASKLRITSNQLKLLPHSMPHVQEAEKINEMVGGAGYLILTLKTEHDDEGNRLMVEAIDAKVRGEDKKSKELATRALAEDEKNIVFYQEKAPLLKETSDRLYDRLIKLPEVSFIQHKFNLEFLKKKQLYFWKTPDLKEAIRRVSIKRDELIEKSNPFYIDLGQQSYDLNLKDLMKKYTRIGKKEIVDEYYVSPNRRMLVMLIKPTFGMEEVEKSRRLIATINDIVKEINPESKGVEVGFTGGYAQFVATYDSVKNSLQPTMLLSLTGITIILFVFLRSFRIILALLVSLLVSIAITYGITYWIIGELNIVTAIFGGILAGFGIDFGIHFYYRFREEYSHSDDLNLSLREAIIKTGSAAFNSAATTAAAFVALYLSDFKGFSDFGLISAYGILITAIVMFYLTALQITIYAKLFPHYTEKLKHDVTEKESDLISRLPFKPASRIILAILPFLLVFGIWYGKDVRFDNDYRNMMDADVPTERLRHEVQIRYDMSHDPQVIAVDTEDEAEALWERLENLSDESEWIAQVASVFSFLPPREQQLRNAKEIQKFKMASTRIKEALVPAEYRKYYGSAVQLMEEKPFGFHDIPEEIRKGFHSVPASKRQGWLTFIYPEQGKMTTAEDLAALEALIGKIDYPVVGNRTLRTMIYEVLEGNGPHRHSVKGDTELHDFGSGLKLTGIEVSAVLDYANRATKEEMESVGIFPLTIQSILSRRPFHSIEELRSDTRTVRATGNTILLSKFMKIVKQESLPILNWTAALVIGILLLGFRDIRSVLIALSPLITGLIVMLGLLSLVDIRINYFNVIVFPIIIGYGIDNGIFLFQRYLENGSVSTALRTTTGAVAASSLTTLAGWASLSIAVHPGIRSMGFMALIGLSIMMVASLTLLPAILQLAAEGKLGRKFRAFTG